MANRVMVIGWDCAPPELVLDAWKNELPNIGRLMQTGMYGPLRSTDPPITVPAWTSMMSSRNPGVLGFYGFRNRRTGEYDGKFIATSSAIKVPRAWEIASQAGKRVCVLNVPQTYPIKPVNGVVVSCFLTPSTDSDFVYPKELKKEVQQVADGYIIDVDNFRTEDKQWLLDEIYRMTDKQFAVARHFLQKERWDFFMQVQMGPDRLGHGFWKYCDVTHPKYEVGNCFEGAMLDYYRHIDAQLGELVSLAGDDVTVLVVSDHGGKAMKGSLNLNEWLMNEGYLVLKEPVSGVTRFREEMVDWSRTKAWGWGGYYARVFMNVEGREPQGIIPQSEYERERAELIRKLEAIPDDQGRSMATHALKPEDLYYCPQIQDAPDLIVYFDDLHWRAGQDVGHGTIWSFDTEIGPDDSVHDYYGMFLMSPAPAPGRRDDLNILDVGPTVLKLMGLPVPPEMEGKPLL
ncbi:MAG: phosphodiesterase [Armatimonadetes bacterium]|nr:phosphodiesterase [Armatimonadota bacterium]